MPAMKIAPEKGARGAGRSQNKDSDLDKHGMYPPGWFESPREHPRPSSRDYQTQVKFQARLDGWRVPQHYERFHGHGIVHDRSDERSALREQPTSGRLRSSTPLGQQADTGSTPKTTPTIRRRPLPERTDQHKRVDSAASHREAHDYGHAETSKSSIVTHQPTVAKDVKIIDSPLRTVSMAGSVYCTTPKSDDSEQRPPIPSTLRLAVVDAALAEMAPRKTATALTTSDRPGSAYALVKARREELRKGG